MKDVVAGNPGALALAESLWRFFGYRLLCSQPREDTVSRIRYGIKDYVPVVKPSEITPSILLAKSARMEEALVHELLHLELLRLGYPRFFFDWIGAKRDGLARGIQNCADHVVMLPLFVRLGYATDRFQTPGEITETDAQRVNEIQALVGLQAPDGYASSVSAYLRKHGFSFRLCYVRA
jgi:hypothetical protein